MTQKPTPAQRRMLENLNFFGPDEYCVTAYHPKPRSGLVRTADVCNERGWITSTRTRQFYRTLEITDLGRRVLEGEG